ncbi:hypothetical protein GH714_002889 [Hevea brasiliensis]|uniref:Uncharacterized protein n=1 Tax=Hevea brasiliensis TaxID=3981 RepID=A0A6A6KG15_HEVBR|nr:hypothetical protein GH714_002889 [Hevea brasiliensis]
MVTGKSAGENGSICLQVVELRRLSETNYISDASIFEPRSSMEKSDSTGNSVSPTNTPLASATACLALSLIKLIKRHYVEISKGDTDERNRQSALTIFYALTLAKALFFLMEKAYWEWKVGYCKLLEEVNKECELAFRLLQPLKGSPNFRACSKRFPASNQNSEAYSSSMLMAIMLEENKLQAVMVELAAEVIQIHEFSRIKHDVQKGRVKEAELPAQ